MRMFPLIIATTLSVGLATAAAAAPTLDAAGKCRDDGKFVVASMCKAPAPAGKCRNIKTKAFAKCGAANTEAVPMKAKMK